MEAIAHQEALDNHINKVNKIVGSSVQQHDQDLYSQLFEYGVVGMKFAMLASLMGLSLKNTDVTFISKEPRKFLYESILVGACTAIPTAFIAHNRGVKKSEIFHACFLAFLVFFIFHILMEMSSMNNSEAGKSESDDLDNLNYYVFNKWVYIIVLIVLIFMSGLAAMVVGTHWKTFTEDFKINKGIYGLEMLFFGFMSTVPFFFIAKNRNTDYHHVKKESWITFAMYSVLYVGLQCGGFFTNIFGNISIK